LENAHTENKTRELTKLGFEDDSMDYEDELEKKTKDKESEEFWESIK